MEGDRDTFERHQNHKTESRDKRNNDRSMYRKHSEMMYVVRFEIQNAITL